MSDETFFIRDRLAGHESAAQIMEYIGEFTQEGEGAKIVNAERFMDEGQDTKGHQRTGECAATEEYEEKPTQECTTLCAMCAGFAPPPVDGGSCRRERGVVVLPPPPAVRGDLAEFVGLCPATRRHVVRHRAVQWFVVAPLRDDRRHVSPLHKDRQLADQLFRRPADKLLVVAVDRLIVDRRLLAAPR